MVIIVSSGSRHTVKDELVEKVMKLAERLQLGRRKATTGKF